MKDLKENHLDIRIMIDDNRVVSIKVFDPCLKPSYCNSFCAIDPPSGPVPPPPKGPIFISKDSFKRLEEFLKKRFKVVNPDSSEKGI